MAYSGSAAPSAPASVPSPRRDSLESTIPPTPLTGPLATVPGYSIVIALPSAPTRAVLVTLALAPARAVLIALSPGRAVLVVLPLALALMLTTPAPPMATSTPLMTASHTSTPKRLHVNLALLSKPATPIFSCQALCIHSDLFSKPSQQRNLHLNMLKMLSQLWLKSAINHIFTQIATGTILQCWQVR